MTLNTSEKSFQSFKLYFLLPEIKGKFTLIIESINSVDGGAFVITSEKEKVFRVLDFIGEH